MSATRVDGSPRDDASIRWCPMELGRFRVGLRVTDVVEAARFYRGLDFEDVAAVPGPDGDPVMIMLQREGAMFIVVLSKGCPLRRPCARSK
jgi:hypothetical protein